MTNERRRKDRQAPQGDRSAGSPGGANSKIVSFALRALFWGAMLSLYLVLHWATESFIENSTFRLFVRLGFGIPLFLLFSYALAERLLNRPLTWREILAAFAIFFGKPFLIFVVAPALFFFAAAVAVSSVCGWSPR